MNWQNSYLIQRSQSQEKGPWLKENAAHLKDFTCLDHLSCIKLKIDQHKTDCLEGWMKEISPHWAKVRCKLIFVLSVCTSNTNNWLKPCSYIFTCRETLQFWGHINRWKNEISSHLKEVNCSSATFSAHGNTTN